MTELIVAGEAFNVLVEGEEGAPVLMLSNSLGTNLHMWDKQMPAFLEHFRVVRYDTRGHGGSRVTEGPYSIAQLGRDAVSIMDALRLEKVHWLGLSMGGMIGQWLLTHVPERIDRAVLANTSAQIGTPDLWNERIRVALEDGMSGLAQSVVERWFTKSFRETHPEDVATILEVLETTSPEGYAACCGAIRDMDQLDKIRSITKPVLVIAGRHDPATPPAMSELIADAIAGAKLVTLEAAHLSNIEEPEAFDRAVLDFLTAEEQEVAEEVIEETIEETSPAAIEEPVEEPAIEEPVEEPAIEAHAAEDASAGNGEPHADEPAVEAPKKPPRKRTPRKAAVEAAPAIAPEPEVPVETSLEMVAEIETLPEAATEEPAPPEPAPAKKPAARRRPTKKTPAKRSPARKPARGVTKKAPAKKAPAKKSAVKKAAAKKTSARRVAAKKTNARPAPRKTATKKTAKRKSAAKKVTARKSPTRKSAVRKAVTKKTVAKRAPVKKLTAKKLGVKKIVKKTAIKKTAGKKTVAKKPLRRSVQRRAPARKTAARRGPGRKR
jgi:3-oxoadipate enol-lactonase